MTEEQALNAVEKAIDKAFERCKKSSIPSSSGSFLSEAILIMENLMAYGRIHTVKGVRYVEGSHEEMLDKAEIWLNKVHKNYR